MIDVEPKTQAQSGDAGASAAAREAGSPLPAPRDLGGFSARAPLSSDYRRRWLVAVGVNHYGDEGLTGIPSLRNAANDACRFHQLMTGRFGFEGSLLVRPSDFEAYAGNMEAAEAARLRADIAGCGTSLDILAAIHRIASMAAPDDLFTLMFAGHGLREGRGYLVPYGAIRDRHSTHLMYDTLWGAMAALPCLHRVMVLDCCYSGRVSAALDGGAARAQEIQFLPRTVVIAATDEQSKAFDCVVPSGAHSPFSLAAFEFLESLKPGEAFEPEQLYSHLHAGAAALRRQNGSFPLPVVFTLDGGRILLRRPGVSWANPTEAVAEPGAAWELQLRPQGAESPWKLEISQPRPSLPLRLQGDTLKAAPSAEDIGLHEVLVRLRDARGLEAACAIRLQVRERDPSALRVAASPAPPCLVGLPYRFSPSAAGGKPPFRWEAEGLPEGLVLMPDAGAISGCVPRPEDSLSLKCQWMVRLRVTDSEGTMAERRFHLSLVDTDLYCDVPEGQFMPGYVPSIAREKELDRLGILGHVREVCKERTGLKPVAMARFFIKRTPVTQAEWRRFMEQTGALAAPSRWNQPDYAPEREMDLPVTDIPRAAMEAYCAWRGTRLPRGWEWEKAAKGVDGRLFPWGDFFCVDNCNTSLNYWGDLTPVGQYPWSSSPCGALDMAGNACEVVQEHKLAGGSWLQCLRGGSHRSGVLELLACASMPGGESFQIRVPSDGIRIGQKGSAHSPQIGFRDVVELPAEPLLPQAFLPLAASWFQAPHSTPPRVVATRALKLARYPVTNEEYLQFTTSAMHPPPPHWAPSGEPFRWADRHLPVVWVSYDDAVAFCRWKSRQMDAHCHVMTLDCWLAAAHGPGSGRNFPARPYPWGAEFSASFCNDAVSGLGSPIPVFDLPEGRSANGCFQLLGNVFEWVGPDLAVGGSWATQCRDPKQWLRSNSGPQADVGFRHFTLGG